MALICQLNVYLGTQQFADCHPIYAFKVGVQLFVSAYILIHIWLVIITTFILQKMDQHGQ